MTGTPRVLDCRGLFCPVPIVRTADEMKRMVEGEEVELLADDPGVPGDLKAWCRGSGHELVSLEVSPDGSGVTTSLLRKRSRRGSR